MTGNEAEIRRECEELLRQITDLDGGVSKAAYYLPPYDIRQSRHTLSDLRKSVSHSQRPLRL